jgi:hypothetical protein
VQRVLFNSPVANLSVAKDVFDNMEWVFPYGSTTRELSIAGFVGFSQFSTDWLFLRVSKLTPSSSSSSRSGSEQ